MVVARGLSQVHLFVCGRMAQIRPGQETAFAIYYRLPGANATERFFTAVVSFAVFCSK
jgi:hypothetical protein